MYYTVQATKTIGGTCESVPVLTMDTEEQARAKFEGMIRDAQAELDAPMMREVGGQVDLFLGTCESILGLGDSDVIECVTVKRPLHSPSAMVCKRG